MKEFKIFLLFFFYIIYLLLFYFVEPIDELLESTNDTPVVIADSPQNEDQHTPTLDTPLVIDENEPLKTDTLKQEDSAEILNLSESNLSVVVGKPDMQSFEEWKEMKLKEIPETPSASTQSSSDSNSKEASSQAKSEQNQQQQQQQNTKKPVKKEKKHQDLVPRHKNYAGLDCGAKIIDNNPESSNPAHILTENKDDYMLNSCKNNVWFIIELCEPIKLIEFSLANFELFSNVPRQFRIYTSERYIQTSNWNTKHLIGTFEAQNTRTIQTFSVNDLLSTPNTVKDSSTETTTVASTDGVLNNANTELLNESVTGTSQTYVKYVKFEMVSHYGTEHFCPLSLVRIYGKTKNDDEVHDGTEESTEDSSSESMETANALIVNQTKKGETGLDGIYFN